MGASLARINIEDSLLKDDKFTDLCIKLGSRILGLGVILEAFILAQKHYTNEENERLIPLIEWDRKKDLHILIDVGFAEKRGSGIYVKGSNECFKWLIQRSEAGKASAASKRIKQQKKSTVVQRDSTSINETQPLYLTLTPSLTQNISLKYIHPLGILWNTYAPKELPRIKAVDDKRLRLIKKVFDKISEQEWIEVFKRIEKSDWLMGRNSKSNGWKCSFNFAIENYIKIMEGNYDGTVSEEKKDNWLNAAEKVVKAVTDISSSDSQVVEKMEKALGVELYLAARRCNGGMATIRNMKNNEFRNRTIATLLKESYEKLKQAGELK